MDRMKKPCQECPFRKTSLAGWLGPWQPQQLLENLQHEPFPCHLTITEEAEAAQNYADPNLRLCAGSLIMMNNTVQLSRDPMVAAAQQSYKDIDQSVKNDVFASKPDFIKYHTRDRDKEG